MSNNEASALDLFPLRIRVHSFTDPPNLNLPHISVRLLLDVFYVDTRLSDYIYALINNTLVK